MSHAPSGILPLQVEVNLENHFSTEVSAAQPSTRGNNNPVLPLPTATWETWFRCWLDSLHLSLSPIQAYELSLRLTDNAEIQALNAQYRQKDQPTDVLAFATLEVDFPQTEINEPLYLGDIIISVEMAQQQAQGHTLHQELAWLAAHALLHLLGWDHPTEGELLRMLQKQAWLLEQVGVAAPDYSVKKNTD